MKGRRIDDLNEGTKLLVYNALTKNWEHIPEGLGVYTLGFPCTPWSMSLGDIWVLQKLLSLSNSFSWVHAWVLLMWSKAQPWQRVERRKFHAGEKRSTVSLRLWVRSLQKLAGSWHWMLVAFDLKRKPVNGLRLSLWPKGLHRRSTPSKPMMARTIWRRLWST